MDYGICSVHRTVHITTTIVHYMFQTNGSEGENKVKKGFLRKIDNAVAVYGLFLENKCIV